MSTVEQPRRQNRARRRGREKLLRLLLVVVGLVVVFLLGMAFAETLDDRPEPGGTETIVRTLTPLPQEAPVRTVTVTVTSP
jgi:multisubunit Na+/H+ antiporter MnhB subunit